MSHDNDHDVLHQMEHVGSGIVQSQTERERLQREAVEERARQVSAEDVRLEALSTADLWREASRNGRSAYLERKLVDAEGCRYLPDDSIVIPLLRYDWPREEALVGTQRIWPNGNRRLTAGFGTTGAALRLGLVDVGGLILVCEGYAAGLTLRMATDRRMPVVVALDAYNLLPVCELLRALYPEARLLICADDDWRTEGNPGRDKARLAAKAVERCDFVWPSFASLVRGEKDTDYNDLHRLGGLRRVHVQLRATLDAIRRYRHAA